MLKKISILFVVVAFVWVQVFFEDWNAISEPEKQEVKGGKLYWQNRIGNFESTEAYAKVVDQVRNEIVKTPSRRALGVEWNEVGPDNIGGRTRALLVDSENPNLLFAGGVSGGLWFSEDGGQSWKQTTPGDKEEFLTVTCITQDNSGYIYYGTGESLFYGAPGVGAKGFLGKGVFRSKSPHGTDFEHLPSTWTLLNKSNFAGVNAMASDENGNVYAACLNRLYRTQDNGVTWSIVSSTDAVSIFGTAWDIAVSPSGFVIVALGNEIFTSASGNEGSFSAIPNTELPNFTGRITLAIAPSDENVMYISSATSSGELDAIYQSKDKGVNWSKIIGGGSSLFAPFTGGGPQGDYDQCIAVYPDNPNRILLGGIELYRWEEGENWEKLSQWNSGWNDHNYIHADEHTIRFDHSNPDLFYIGTDGGVFRTKDDGEIFERLNRGFSVTQLYGLAFGSDGVVLAGTQDNSNVYIDGLGNTEESAELHNTGDGGWSAISQLNPNAFFVESQYGRIRRNNTRSNTYSEFFYHKYAKLNNANTDYDGSWNEFVTPFVLWESKKDGLIPDSISFVATKNHSIGEHVDVASGISTVKFEHTFSSPLNQSESIKLKNPVQSLFVYPSFQSIWITREALDFAKTPNWIQLTNVGLSTGSQIGATALAISDNGDDLYYGTRKGDVYRVSNLSKVVDSASAVDELVVTQIGDLKTKSGGDAYITSISVDPNDREHVIVTIGYYDENVNVYVSTSAATVNDASSFVSIQGNLPKFPVYGSLIENYSGAYVVGTEYGVYTSTDDGVSWSREVDVPYCPVIMISQQTWGGAKNFGQIYVATHGRGVFTSEHYVGSNELTGNDKLEKTELKVFPNPAINQLNLDLLVSINGNYPIEIFNMEGKLIQSTTKNFVNGISKGTDISNLITGNYFIVVKSNSRVFRGSALKK